MNMTNSGRARAPVAAGPSDRKAESVTRQNRIDAATRKPRQSTGQLDDGDTRVGAVEIDVGANRGVSLRQLAALKGIPGESLTNDHQAHMSLFAAKVQRFPDGRAQPASDAGGTPTMDDLQQGDPFASGAIELHAQPFPSLLHGGTTKFQVDRAHPITTAAPFYAGQAKSNGPTRD